ncbi:MAG: MBL fold metallo-hydrolase [Cyanobacteria bacterium J06597_1]
MLRRSVAAIAGLALASGVGGSLTVAIAQPEAVEFETQAITDNIQVLMGGGGNVGVFSGDDGVFLIDDSLAPATDQLLAAVAEISDSPIEYVISTHWHFDHTGGNEALGETGTLIVAHDNVRERMSVDVFIESINQEFPASPDVALPVITFNDAVTFHLNGESVNVFHVEGRTRMEMRLSTSQTPTSSTWEIPTSTGFTPSSTSKVAVLWMALLRQPIS